MAHAPIVRYAIHPALGIARVGSAPAPADAAPGEEGYYITSEVPGVAAAPEGGFKTPDGQLKRGVARFRVYGYDADGNVVQEITSADAQITWRVHVVNRKSAWYRFYNAMDIGAEALDTTHRNDAIQGDQRRQLAIDPGPRTITGNGVSGRAYQFASGFIRFPDAPQDVVQVYLGELRTDAQGRLLFLGGRGQAGSVYGELPSTFANNEGWYDDTSDGTVRATITVGGKDYDAEPAMVAVAPPNYAPGIFPVTTMWDVVHDLYLRQGWVTPEPQIVFWQHIYPLFARLVDNQWVNHGLYILFGAGSPSDLTSKALLDKLSSPDAKNEKLRQQWAAWFRSPQIPVPEARPEQRPDALPPFYGDGYGEFRGTDIADLGLTTTQYEWLDRWAKGDFVTGDGPSKITSLDDIDLADRPAAIDRAHLEDCLGGPFHPGIELTWTLRVPTMWQPRNVHDKTSLAYRLNVLPEGQMPKDDFGPVLTPAVALGKGGPTDGAGPGSLTRWQGVPWQTDEASCLAGYDLSTYLALPSFWSSRVPNEVLSVKAYHRVLDANQPLLQRMKHLAYRQFWLRDIDTGSQERRAHMVAEWDKMGIVTAVDAPSDGASLGLGQQMWVELGRDDSFEVNDPTWSQVQKAESTSVSRGAPPALRAAILPARHKAAAVEPAEIIGNPLRRRRDRGNV
ncbi:LodA/GoxA family CTQ-dependent oxidase [Chondromyces crocatus]|uniref:L-lysine 6-oxidase n=1 Tax=Chondromyces crocatus TaxID=52 RepID=A0A0K1EB88_CHOCO|nr:LodA/GoxA family CTQ-dependent oxidase [Chondromyces crocatus]AKT38109.1 uncharacterized protein CMC5_022510 [Chondromyces crocatus]